VQERLKKHDVDLVLVSLAQVKDAAEWRRVTGYEGELYLDDTTQGDPRNGVAAPASEGYAAFKLNRGPSFVMNDKNKELAALAPVYAELGDTPDLMALTTEAEEGVTIYPGDVFQVGGCFVLGPGNLCDFAHRSEYAGDHCDLPAVIAAATGVLPDGQEMVYESTRQWYAKLNLGLPALGSPSVPPVRAPTWDPPGMKLLLDGASEEVGVINFDPVLGEPIVDQAEEALLTPTPLQCTVADQQEEAKEREHHPLMMCCFLHDGRLREVILDSSQWWLRASSPSDGIFPTASSDSARYRGQAFAASLFSLLHPSCLVACL